MPDASLFRYPFQLTGDVVSSSDGNGQARFQNYRDFGTAVRWRVEKKIAIVVV